MFKKDFDFFMSFRSFSEDFRGLSSKFLKYLSKLPAELLPLKIFWTTSGLKEHICTFWWYFNYLSPIRSIYLR